MGKARVLVDQVDRGEYCLYSPTPTYNVAQTFSDLGEGKHTLLIRPLGEICGGSDANISLDKLVVGSGTFESTDGKITWASWRLRKTPRRDRMRLDSPKAQARAPVFASTAPPSESSR